MQSIKKGNKPDQFKWKKNILLSQISSAWNAYSKIPMVSSYKYLLYRIKLKHTYLQLWSDTPNRFWASRVNGIADDVVNSNQLEIRTPMADGDLLQHVCESCDKNIPVAPDVTPSNRGNKWLIFFQIMKINVVYSIAKIRSKNGNGIFRNYSLGFFGEIKYFHFG